MSFLVDLLCSLPWKAVERSLKGAIYNIAHGIVPQPSLPHEWTKQHQRPAGNVEGPLPLPIFTDFVSFLLDVSKTVPVTILACIVYLRRLSSRLSPKSYGNKETAYRVFVAALIIATKFLHDGAWSTNVWASSLSPWFSLVDINTMERQFLHCIDYDLTLTMEQLECVILQDEGLCNLLCPFDIAALGSQGCQAPPKALTIQSSCRLPAPDPIFIYAAPPLLQSGHYCSAPAALSKFASELDDRGDALGHERSTCSFSPYPTPVPHVAASPLMLYKGVATALHHSKPAPSQYATHYAADHMAMQQWHGLERGPIAPQTWHPGPIPDAQWANPATTLLPVLPLY